MAVCGATIITTINGARVCVSTICYYVDSCVLVFLRVSEQIGCMCVCVYYCLGGGWEAQWGRATCDATAATLNTDAEHRTVALSVCCASV